MKNQLSQLLNRLKNNMNYHAGYPINYDFEDSDLYQLLTCHMNNIGDPFLLKSPFSTHEYEYEVVKWFLKLYGLDTETGWGYVTSGGTEGTLFGLWQGKELLDRPILYCAQSAHYSVYKAARLLGLELKMIPCDHRGVLYYDEMAGCVDKGRDAIFLVTLGSTMTSSLDDVARIKATFNNCGIRSYIHADAALDGMILPFINSPYSYKLTDGIDSVSISGHKLIGASAPCGVVLIHRQHINQINKNIPYINNMDCTLTGSRSGYAPMILWSKIKAKGVMMDLKRLYSNVFKTRKDMLKYLMKMGLKLGVLITRLRLC
ncbi:MAG: histidine decarboxylase [Pseudomonadota bacterium]